MAIQKSSERQLKVRRTAQLCCSFAINIAYYRAGWSDEHKHLLDARNGNFWRVVNGNFLDISVLEWCKLFADREAKHHWRRVVRNPERFERELLEHLQIHNVEWQDAIAEMLEYRDKFVAHLDACPSGQYPHLDIPKRAVWFLYLRLLAGELKARFSEGLPKDLEQGYLEEAELAKLIYSSADGTGSRESKRFR